MNGSLFSFPFALVVGVFGRIGWTCGCWDGYPNRWYKRTRLVRWLATFDPVEYP